MKRLGIILILVICSINIDTLCLFGEQVNYSLDINAVVPLSAPRMNMQLFKLTSPDQLPWDGEPAGGLHFGTLTNTHVDGTEDDIWFAPIYFCAILYTDASGNAYSIWSTGHPITHSDGSGAKLKDKSFCIRPLHIAEDRWGGPGGTPQGSLPPGARVGGKLSPEGEITWAVGTREVYWSENKPGVPSKNRIIRVYYSIPPRDAGGNPPFTNWVGNKTSSTQMGTYSRDSGVVITIAAQ